MKDLEKLLQPFTIQFSQASSDNAIDRILHDLNAQLDNPNSELHQLAKTYEIMDFLKQSLRIKHESDEEADADSEDSDTSKKFR